jgi:hypothetical protein
MTNRCSTCSYIFDDVFYSTVCPHEPIAMHAAVFVGGQPGCAHTIEELSGQTEPPHPDCPFHLLREAIIAHMPLEPEAINALTNDLLTLNLGADR